MDLVQLINTDSIHVLFIQYLWRRELRALLQTSHTVRNALMESSYTWRMLDLSDTNTTEAGETIWYAQNFCHMIRSVSLDWCSPEYMAATIEDYLSDLMNLEHISLVGIGSRKPHFVENPTDLEIREPLQALIHSKTRGCHKLTSVSLLGGPGFPPGFSSLIAKSVIDALDWVGIKTDAVFCTKEDDELHGRRTLQEAKPRTCCLCDSKTSGCTPCLNKRTCKICNKYWCDDCPISLEMVCYECGRSCSSCSKDNVTQCKQCSSTFCTSHTFANDASAAEGRRRNLCDWCIEGEKSRSRDR